MNKEYLEALNWLLANETIYRGRTQLPITPALRYIKHLLESIDNTKPNEGLNKLEELKYNIQDEIGYHYSGYTCCKEEMHKYDEDFAVIEKSLLNAQKEHAALEIIKEKKVDMWHLTDLLEQTYEMYLAFCKSEKYEEDYILTEEEFDLLKEVLE